MMQHIPSVRMLVVVFATAMMCGMLPVGCQSQDQALNLKDESRLEKPVSFQEGADRPPTMKTLYAYAEMMAAEGYDKECEQVLRNIIDTNPNFVPAYNTLAEVQMRQQRVDDAIETLETALLASPADPTILNNLGICWIARNDFNKALDNFTKAAEQKPNNTRYLGNMALALGMLGREEESMALYQQILPQAQAEHNVAVLSEARRDMASPVIQKSQNKQGESKKEKKAASGSQGEQAPAR